MNAVFELEVLLVLHIRGQIVPQNSPAVAEAISVYSNWFVAREQQAYFQNLIIIIIIIIMIIITLLLSKFWLFKVIQYSIKYVKL